MAVETSIRSPLKWLDDQIKGGGVMAIETFRKLLKRLNDQTVLWLWQEGSLSGELNGLLAKEAIRRKLIEKVTL